MELLLQWSMNALQDGQQLDVPNPHYGEFGENANASDSESFEQNSPSHNQQARKNTFPYNELPDSTAFPGSHTLKIP